VLLTDFLDRTYLWTSSEERTLAHEKTLTPQRWMSRGEAIVEGRGKKPVLVWGGIPGEESFIRIVGRGTNQDYGVWLSSEKASPYRVAPGCSKLSACGGCPLLHVNAAGQEEARRRIVGAALSAEGLKDIPLGKFFESPDGLREYRHTIKVGIGFSDQGRPRLGAWGRRTRNIVAIPDCPVTTPELRRTMKALSHHYMDMELAPYDPQTEKGLLRAAVLRQSRETNEIVITLVASRYKHDLKDLAERVAQQVTAVVGVWVHLNDDPGNAIFQRNDQGAVGVRLLVGKAELEETLNGVTYRVGPGDFFQTNPAVADLLYRRSMERLALQPEQAVIDLYAGVGGFALQAARITGWALGVEAVDGAVLRARSAAKANGIRAEFISSAVNIALIDLQRRYSGTQPIVCLNPARRGLEEGVAEAVIALEASKILYVSCNPRALARDLKIFRDAGYEIGPVDMFDMFPNTPHVECLTVLSKQGAKGPSKRAPRRKVVR
jgi:23S rRNA (uracil1939-C5)-methyltransferase